MGSHVSSILAEASANFGNVSAALKEFWVKRALTRLTPDLVFVPICSEGGPGAWKELPVHEGMLVHFHRLPVFAAATTAITEDANDPAATTAALVGVTAKIKTYGDWVQVGDLAEDAAMNGAFDAMSEGLAQGMMRTADTLVYDQIKTAGTSAATEAGASIASTVLTAEASHGCTRANLDYMAYRLKANNVRTFQTGKAKGLYKYIASPLAVKSLRSITAVGGYVDLAKNLGVTEALEGAHVGNISNFAVYETTELTTGAVSAATSSQAIKCVAAGYESVGMVSMGGNASRVPSRGTGMLINNPEYRYRTNVELITKALNSGGALNPLNRRGSVGYKIRTVAKVLDADRVFVHLVYGGTA